MNRVDQPITGTAWNVPHTRGDEPRETDDFYFTSHVPHTRGDEPMTLPPQLLRLYHVPHTRGDEPLNGSPST